MSILSTIQRLLRDSRSPESTGRDYDRAMRDSQPPITIYTTPWCGYCHRAKRILADEDLDFEEIDVDGDAKRRAWLVEVSGQRTVPQIFFGETSIGGCSELTALVRSGRLEAALRDAE